ncbi:hypothetical protein C6N75_22290 [Streptomyces solincola]|uniref:L,D-transpeptidase n=1 Tax=Streptomyces solincola TaxID=2100817 RepID=A0A2S9PRP4_9ACTN|nr:L,D-transpeptidase [Streptomyces solincola]PRH77063.1 hypothetical protein C6N75_22290 [Streptomyces solincola]
MHARRRTPTWAWVSALTVAALVAVAVLAVQARGKVPEGGLASARPSASPSAGSADGKSGTPRPTPKQENAVPEDSGEGRRVVYSLGQRRVWLVGENELPLRTFAVWPGGVAPAEGEHKVSTRRAAGNGSDGVPVEHVVYFANTEGVWVAFSHAADGAAPTSSPEGRGGAVRTRPADGEALWEFAATGTPVRVVG